MYTTFAHTYDLSIYYTMIRERDRRFFPSIPYRRLLTEITETDPIHHEISEEDKRFADPVGVHASFRPDEEIERVDEMGGEEVRDVTLEISVPSLLAAGLATQDDTTKIVTVLCKAGDRFDFGGITYEVLDCRLFKTYVNTDIPTTFELPAVRYREDVTDYT